MSESDVIRSALIELDLKDNGIVSKLNMLNGASNDTVNALKALDGTNTNMQRSLAALSPGLQSAGQSLLTFAENNKLALTAVSALSTGLAYSATSSAIDDESISAAFHAMVSKTGVDSEKLLQNMKLMSAGTISETDLMRTAIKAATFGISLDEIPKAMDVARRSTRMYGGDMQKNFDTLIMGSATHQVRLLRSIGLSVDATKANNDYAASLGKSASALTEDELSMAMLTSAIKDGQSTFPEITGSALNTSEAFAKLHANISNLTGEMGKTFIPAASLTADVLTKLTSAVEDHPWITLAFSVGLAGVAIGSFALLTAGVLFGSVIPAISAGALALSGLTAAEAAMVLPTIGLTGALGTLAGAIWAVLAPAIPFLAVGAAIVLVGQDIYTGMTGGKSAIMDFADSLGVFKYALYSFLPIIPTIEGVIWAFLHWREIPGIVSGAISGAIDYLKGLPSVFYNAGAGLFTAFITGLKSIPLVGPVISALEQVRSYLPFSDAKVGPLADLTLSGQRFMQTFGAGMESQRGYLSSLMGGLLPGLTFPASSGSQTTGQSAPIQVSVTITGNNISGDEASLGRLGAVTVDAVEKALDKIIGKQAISKGW
jgi:hypothetical protein